MSDIHPLERVSWLVLMVLALLVWGLFLISGALADDQHEHANGRPVLVQSDEISDPGYNNHPPEHLQLHEQFYKDWMRLDIASGTASCCSLQDCYPTVMLEARDGSWWALRYAAAMLLEASGKSSRGEGARLPPLSDGTSWIRVPDNLIEHNSDRVDLGVLAPRLPRESPDGRSHACILNEAVYCAVVGSGL